MIQTPSYVFDINAFCEQIRRVKEAWGIGLCYSIKANPFLVGKTPDAIDWLEVCSPGELAICKEKRIDPKMILFSGVNKTEQSVREAFDYGVGIFTAESILHADLIDQEAGRKGTKAKTLLRLSAGSQFGMSEEDLTKILATQKDGAYANLQIIGLHYFSGTQKTKVKEIEKELQMLDAFLQMLKEQYDFVPEQVEYGTGLGVEYFISTKDETSNQEKDLKL
ncbi:MAG: alanine racemase, partial [Lachnospiraceae bacterium]|nr:alanine racemase [Lachnospiraceae bacterium]